MTSAVRGTLLPTRSRAERPSGRRAGGRRRPPGAGRRSFGLMAMGAPTTALFAALVVVPIGVTVHYSLNDVNFLRDEISWVGFSNYAKLWESGDFRHALYVTLLIAAASVVVPNALGLLFAVLLDAGSRLYTTLRIILFAPFVLSPLVVGLTFRWTLANDGSLNNALEALGIPGPEWISSPNLAVVSVGLALSWQLVAFATVLYVAALRAIPTDLYEAASIDGASGYLRFRLITWPLVAPAVTITTLISLISALKLYDHVVALTGGGPGRSSETVGLAIIRAGFTQNRAGLASAMAVLLLVITAATTAISLRVLRRREVEL